MGDDADKVKLLAGKNWYVIITNTFGSMFLVGITICFDIADNEFDIIWLLIVAVSLIIFTTAAVLAYYTATLDKNGILFKAAIWKLAYVKWTDIVKADVRNLATLQSTFGTVGYKHIILYTGPNQDPGDGGGNSIKPPWQIIYNKKNARIVKEYLKKYTNITLNENVKQVRKNKQKPRLR